MPYRPCTEDERSELLAKIKQVTEALAVRQRYLSRLQEQLEQGVWYFDPVEAAKSWERILADSDVIATKKFYAEHSVLARAIGRVKR